MAPRWSALGFVALSLTGGGVLAASLSACGDDSETAVRDAGSVPVHVSIVDAGVLDRDAAQDGGSQAAIQASPDLVCTGDLPVMTVQDRQTNTALDPDWSCYAGDHGPAADVDAGTVAPARTAIFRLGTLGPLLGTGVVVDFFFDPSTLGTPALTRVFEGGETVAFDVPAGSSTVSVKVNPLARDNPSLSIVELREYGFPIPADDTPIEGYVTIRDSRTLLASLALGGGKDDPSKAMIVAFARDCLGRELRGAQFELIDGETNLPVPTGTEPGETRASYVQFALPGTTCTFTCADQPAWLLINAPVNISDDTKTHSYRLRLEGRMRETDVEPVILGEREVELFAGVVSVVRVYR